MQDPIPMPPHAFRIRDKDGGMYEFRTHQKLTNEQAGVLMTSYLRNPKNPRAKKGKMIQIPIYMDLENFPV